MNPARDIIDEKGFKNFYVSGCRVKSGTPHETSGCSAYFGHKNRWNFSEGSRKNLSENAGEVRGATLAFERAAGYQNSDKVRMNTSSESLYDVVTKSLEIWKEHDFRNESDGKKIRNCSAYKKLSKAIGNVKDRMTVEFNYVTKGDVHQKKADHMARLSAENYKK